MTCEVDCQKCCQYDVCCTRNVQKKPKVKIVGLGANVCQKLKFKVVGIEKKHHCSNTKTGARIV